MKTGAEPEFCTIPSAACRLGVGVKQLRRACAAGEIRQFSVGSWPRVRISEVRRWIEAQRVPTVPHARARVEEILAREAR